MNEFTVHVVFLMHLTTLSAEDYSQRLWACMEIEATNLLPNIDKQEKTINVLCP